MKNVIALLVMVLFASPVFAEEVVDFQNEQYFEYQKKDTEQIRVSTFVFGDTKYVDMRSFFMPEDGTEYLPTKRGITVPIQDWKSFLSQLKSVR